MNAKRRTPASRSKARKPKTKVAEPPTKASWNAEDIGRQDADLLAKLKANLPALEALLQKVMSNLWVSEDLIYRFYRQSFKVYGLQGITQEIVVTLRKHGELNPWFLQIVQEGPARPFR